jgi:hypothetical protein
MTHSTGFHPYFLGHQKYGTNGDPRTSDHQFYTTAELAFSQGVDGFSLFNFVYYRMGHKVDIPVMEPPWHVLEKLNDTAFLQRQHKYYMLAQTSYHGQLPRQLGEGQSTTFRMQMLRSNVPSDPAQDGRIRIHLSEPTADTMEWLVSFNGQPLKLTADVTRCYGNPFDRMISPVRNRVAFVLPPQLAKDGDNELRISANGKGATVVYIDAAIPALTTERAHQ